MCTGYLFTGYVAVGVDVTGKRLYAQRGNRRILSYNDKWKIQANTYASMKVRMCMTGAYQKKLIKKATIEEAAIRLFTTQYLLGMFGESEYDTIPYTCVESKEHLKLAQRVAEESTVLLKNDGIMPLQKKQGMVLGVIGPNADSRSSLDGNYHGIASRYVAALEGLQDFVGDDMRVMYSRG